MEDTDIAWTQFLRNNGTLKSPKIKPKAGTDDQRIKSVYEISADNVIYTIEIAPAREGEIQSVVFTNTREESDYSEMACATPGGGGCENASGDVNNDGAINVLDIVNVVNHILGNSALVDCNLEAADYNADGAVNVLDIVNIVNYILGNRSDDASSARLIQSENTVSLTSDGYIGGVQMTLKHGADFSIELTGDALIAEYRTEGNQTILVIVVPDGEDLFTYTGSFEIVDMIVANSTVAVDVNVAPIAFSLSAAYPNPFNPSTTMTMTLPEAGNVTVQVYNLMGQVVATLASGYQDASTYTLTWDASDAASGLYIVKAETAGTVSTQKLMLLK